MSNIAVTPPANKVRFIDYRQQIWGDSFTWSFARLLSQVSKLTIHHSVTPANFSPDQIALLHKARGWDGIGYHFVITEDGTVYYVGDIGTGRACVANNNEKTIGILLVGDFQNGRHPTDAQIMACKYLCEYFMSSFPSLVNINTWEDVIGHGEAHKIWPSATETECPGYDWKDNNNSFYYRIRDGRPYNSVTPPSPNPTPNPSPIPGNDTFYRVTYQGKQLGAFKNNPISVINTLNKAINDAKDALYRDGSASDIIAKIKKIFPK